MKQSLQPPGAARELPLRVSELMGGLRALLEEAIGRVWVVGELSNLHRAASGHCFFTLKDDAAQLRAALFKGDAVRIPFELEEGLEVLLQGEISVFPARGDLQIIVRRVEPVGRGALQLAFEQLRARLEAEGLFDESIKRPLPEFPRRVGVVSSPQGAAIHDVIEVSGRRFPAAPLLLAPTRVQGADAEHEIAAALAALCEVSDVDVVLLVRGGGSLEDLQPFNSEVVARAIRNSRAPVVAGIGHEVDVTIADLAADARAPTPSAAVHLALPDRAELRRALQGLAARMARGAQSHCANAAARWVAARGDLIRAARGAATRAAGRLTPLEAALRARAPRAQLAAQRQRLRTAQRALLREARARAPSLRRAVQPLTARLLSAVRARSDAAALRLAAARPALIRGARSHRARAAARLAAAAGRLNALSPLAVLARGYAIIHGPRGEIVRAARQVALGARLRLRLARGEISARVTGRRPEAPDS